MKAIKTNLYKSRYVEFNRYDFKERTQVKVQNNGYNLRVYRAYNIPFYEHQYMSWANLDMCGGWAHDEVNVLKNIKKEQKLAGTYSLTCDTKELIGGCVEEINKRMGFTSEFLSEAVMFEPWETYDHRWVYVIGFARNGKLSDYFNYQEISRAYGRQGINFTAKESVSIQKMMNMEISELMFRNPNGYDPINPRGDDECVITGMLFGYPLESTASFIMGF